MKTQSLTPKQESFCNAIANGKSQSDAYREAYNVKPSTKYEAINVNASKLMADAKVALRVSQLKEELAEKQLWTREDSINKLKETLNISYRPNDVVAIIKELNAMHGYNAPKKVEHSGGQELTIRKLSDFYETDA